MIRLTPPQKRESWITLMSVSFGRIYTEVTLPSTSPRLKLYDGRFWKVKEI